MMTKLTEDMVIARTKSSDLGAVKKLNCWGSDLDDISLVKRLHNVEVLSLSLNKITSLCDFQYCRNLVELYIRRNAIRDLSELVYLQELPRLRRLLLAENPCVETAGPAYRATVIRCLPHLEVLDNSEVSSEEIEHSMKNGLILEHPLARRERNSPDDFIREAREAREDENLQAMNRRNSCNAAQVEYDESVFRSSTALSRSPPPEYSPYSVQGCEPQEVISNGIRRSPSSSPEHLHSQQTGRRNSTIVGIEPITTSPTTPPLELSSSHSPTNNNNCTGTVPPYSVLNTADLSTNHLPRRVQRSPVEPFYPSPPQEQISNGGSSTNVGRISEAPSAYYGQDNSTGRGRSRSGSVDYLNQYQQQQQSAYQQQQVQQRELTYGDRDYHHHHHYPAEDSSPPPPPSSAVQSRTSSSNLSSRVVNGGSVRGRESTNNPNKPPRTKSSNLLSAVLCLIPELDWASLEVVELAVKRRMDELLSD